MITTLIGQLWAIPKVKVFTIVGVVAIVICSFVGVRWYSNKQWAKGEQAGRQNVAEWLIKEKQAEWDTRERQIENSKAIIEEQMRALNRVTAEVVSARLTLRDQYAALAATANAERSADERVIASVPDSELRAAIRAISRELAGE